MPYSVLTGLGPPAHIIRWGQGGTETEDVTDLDEDYLDYCGRRRRWYTVGWTFVQIRIERLERLSSWWGNGTVGSRVLSKETITIPPAKKEKEGATCRTIKSKNRSVIYRAWGILNVVTPKGRYRVPQFTRSSTNSQNSGSNCQAEDSRKEVPSSTIGSNLCTRKSEGDGVWSVEGPFYRQPSPADKLMLNYLTICSVGTEGFGTKRPSPNR